MTLTNDISASISTSSLDVTNEGIVECVPNFSEGRDADKIQQIVDAIAQHDGVKVLHVDMGYDANRTVITFAGKVRGVELAIFDAIAKSAEVIDMRIQSGTHPRMGACDVMPIIPISGVREDEIVAMSHCISQKINRELSIPIYNYEKSAKSTSRVKLEAIRSGEYEGLKAKMKTPDWLPDYGEEFNATAGATVLGVRPFLLAYNVNLATKDVALAKGIASAIRESGKMVNGQRQPGLFKGVKAIGWDVPEYDMVQVSTNITNTEMVGMHDVYEAIKTMANEAGVEVAGSELIGLLPKRCLLESGQFYAEGSLDEKSLLILASERLGLGSVTEFDIEKRVIEYLL